MKQTKFGKKIQNWHRPLAPNALRARYRRLREKDPGLLTRAGISEEDPGGEDWPSDWYEDEIGEDDTLPYWHTQLCSAVLHDHLPLRALGTLFPETPHAIPSRLWEGSPEALVASLATHLERLTRYKGDDPELVLTLRAALDRQSQERLQQYLPKSARELCLFALFWYRSPLTWEPESGVSLPEHLFAPYPVPAFLSQALRRSIRFPDYKWLCWLILLGRSVSLKSAATTFGWNLPGKLPHFLSQVPSLMAPELACACAEVLRLGGTEADLRRLCLDRSYLLDPTDPRLAPGELDFWRETVRWLGAHGGELVQGEVAQVLAWGRHRHTEARARGEQPFRWSGRSVQAVREQSLLYQRNRYSWRSGGELYRWDAHGWDWSGEGADVTGWSVTELTKSSQLGEEGAALRHCVGGYGRRCHAGTSAIFSVRYQEKRRVTVEVNPSTGALVQVHGSYNRQPEPDEQRVVALWHQSVVLPALAKPTPPDPCSGTTPAAAAQATG